MFLKITSYSIDQISELSHFIISGRRIKFDTSSVLRGSRVRQVSFRAWLCRSMEPFAPKLTMEVESRLSRYQPFFPYYTLYITFHVKVSNIIVIFNSNNTWNGKPARGPLDRYIILTSTSGQHQTSYKTTTRSRSIDILTRPSRIQVMCQNVIPHPLLSFRAPSL